MPTIQQYTEEGDEDEEKSMELLNNEKKVEEYKPNELKNIAEEEPINHEDIKMDLLSDTLHQSTKNTLKGNLHPGAKSTLKGKTIILLFFSI